MKPSRSDPAATPEGVTAKCDGADQFKNFDRMIRSVIAGPKAVIDKEAAKRKYERKRAKTTQLA